MNHEDLQVINLSRDNPAGRIQVVRNLIAECEPRLRAFFMDSKHEGGLFIEDPETGREMDRAGRREMWPYVMECIHECCLLVIRRRRFRFYAQGISVLACAAFLIAVHTLLGMDMLRSMGSVRVGLPLQPVGENGQMATVMVDYYAVVLSSLFELSFMPEDLERLFYEVYALTGWKGCAGLEQRGVNAERVRALREEGERYRGVVHSDAEWRALRGIQMNGGHITKTKIGRGGKQGWRQGGGQGQQGRQRTRRRNLRITRKK